MKFKLCTQVFLVAEVKEVEDSKKIKKKRLNKANNSAKKKAKKEMINIQ